MTTLPVETLIDEHRRIFANAGQRFPVEDFDDENVSMVSNTRYAGSIAGFAASRTYSVPSGTAGDVIEIFLTEGNSSHRVIVQGDTGVSINGQTAATEFASLRFANDFLKLRCHATNDWRVETQVQSSDSRWKVVPRSSYTATPASTSSITMSSTSGMRVGLPVRYTYGGVVYYGIVKTVTANTSIDVAGAPLDTGTPITFLEVGNPEQVVQLSTFVAGNYGDDVGDLLVADMKAYVRWKLGIAYLVQYEFTHATAAGTTNPKVNVRIAGNSVGTQDSNLGVQLSTAGTWVVSNAVAISTANYDVAMNDSIEVRCTAAGAGTAAENLSGNLVFVLE